MSLTFLSLTNFRNISTAKLDFDAQGLNIISGINGSGKTSILEAIYFLSMGKSFRTPKTPHLIQQNQAQFNLISQALTENAFQLSIGMERTRVGSSNTRLNNANASVSEVASHLPIRIINSQSHELIEDGPEGRRKFMDWGLFYQDEAFLACWQTYTRALKQRNACLQSRKSKEETHVWTEKLCDAAQLLDMMRNNYLIVFAPHFIEIAKQLLPDFKFQLSYYSGWRKPTFAEELAANYGADLQAGFTQSGPHRADLNVSVDGDLAKYNLSRGQQKLLVCAMILAQGRLLNQSKNRRLIYLLDDVPAELDAGSLRRLMDLLLQQPMQLFVSAIDASVITNLNQYQRSMKVFHVEHGEVKACETIAQCD